MRIATAIRALKPQSKALTLVRIKSCKRIRFLLAFSEHLRGSWLSAYSSPMITETARSAICHAIRSAGQNWKICYEAVDGKSAVEKAIELRPDLLILDLLMPYDGISAGKKIRELLPDTPMVLNTIGSSQTVEQEAKNAGFQVVAEKSDSGGFDAYFQVVG